MARDPIKQRATGKRLQEKLDAEDALRDNKVPRGMMGSSFGYNRPKSPGLLERVKNAYTQARRRRNLLKNPPAELKGAVDISDLEPRRGGKDA